MPDADDDGRGDLLVGAEESPGLSPSGAGRAHLFSGATGLPLLTVASPNEEQFGQFGETVAGVPDADGDGRGDLLVGAYDEDPGLSPQGAGRAYAFSGNDAPSAALAVTAAPLDPPVVIPEEGGAFAFAVTITNVSAVPQAFDAWLVGTLPGGREVVYGRPATAALAPGQSATAQRRVGVPGRAPAGVYGATVRVGSYPDGVVASDGFTFVKEGPAGLASGGGAVPVSEGALAFSGAAGAGVGARAPDAAVSVWPNPSRGAAEVTFTLAAPSEVQAVLYDGLGRRVVVLASGPYGAGSHAVAVDGTALPAGVYVVRLTAQPGVSAPVVTVARLTLVR